MDSLAALVASTEGLDEGLMLFVEDVRWYSGVAEEGMRAAWDRLRVIWCRTGLVPGSAAVGHQKRSSLHA